MKTVINGSLCVCIGILLLTGCAATNLQYDLPQATNVAITDLKIAVAHPEAKRQPNKDVDKMWANEPSEEMQEVIQGEVKSTGLFRETISLAKDEEPHDCQLILNTSLKELAWEIPNLKAQEGKMLVISALTGGLGGLAYGSGSTDFYGKAKMHIILKEMATGKVLIDKEYSSRVAKKMARLKTDSYEQRSKIIGEAVKQVMNEFKIDLDRVIERDMK